MDLLPKCSRPNFQLLIALIPDQPSRLNWHGIKDLWPELHELSGCPQDPWHHAEGDVAIHTKMVVEALIKDPSWPDLPLERKAALFWAAVLHDVGKPGCTRHEEDGRITSRGHSLAGTYIARKRLWEAGIPFELREAICGIIRTHQVPFWLFERENAARMAVEISQMCNTANLCLHARADAAGRICADQAALQEKIGLAELLFSDLECYGQPRAFANDESRISYLTKPDRALEYSAHESYSCTATLMCGLPGSGKDQWISRNGDNQPVISLDDMREKMGLKHGDNVGTMIQAAREEARVHLRAGQDFIWNATNIIGARRRAILEMFRAYGARTRIVYVETGPDQLFAQNEDRPDPVPRNAILRHLDNLDVPNLTEAHQVDYVIHTGRD